MNDGSQYHAIPNNDADGLSSDTAVNGETVTGDDTFSVSATNGFRFITGGASSPNVVTIADDGTNAELTFHSDLPNESGTQIGINSNGKLVKSPSSARYKTNIQPLSTDTSAVLDLEPKAFEYEDSGQESTGLIAEDVDEVLPELVYDDDEGNPESVHYDRVGVYLVPEVDENRDRLDDLDETTADHEACIDDLEAELDEKDARIDDLEETIDDLEKENERKDERVDDLEAENERLRDRLAAIEDHLGLGSSADPAPADD